MSADVIIGGGFAGLAAATRLAAHGREVVLLERRSFLGGRAYSFVDRVTGDVVDNGQHLMMGCYHDTLNFLDRIGSKKKLHTQPQTTVAFLEEGGRSSELRFPALPAPWHLLAGIAGLRSIAWRDRLCAMRVGLAARRLNGNQSALSDTTVHQWLSSLGQSDLIQRRLWNPMAVATLNEQPDRASADLFLRVIQDGFLQSRSDSALVISKVGLSDLYVNDAASFIETRGGAIRTGAEVEAIEFNDGAATALSLRGGERIRTRTLIAAIPPQSLAPLLAERVKSSWTAFSDLQRFENSPIVSINLWYEREVTDLEFVGLLDSRVDWVFNKNKICAKAGPRQHLATVISGANTVSTLTKDQLVDLAHSEMQRFFPAARRTALVHSLVVREHAATISHTVGVARMRPPHATPINNFFLAGDWTDTGLPATIESAVRSGDRCAELALQR
jgi:squalene-associated FAD-dependent desaturase